MLAASDGPPRLEAPVDLYGWRFAGVPIASYGSDLGFTLGGALFFYRPLEGHPDEYRNLTMALSYATRGPRAFDSKLDFPHLRDTSLRTTWNVHLADDTVMPYWGEGAALGGSSVPTGYGTPPEPYRYHDRRLFVAAILRGAIAGPLGWHARARFLDVDVAAQSALLAAANPPGAHGGRVALGEIGLWYDTRDREVDPRRGAFLTAAAFAAPHVDGISDFSFHGYDANARVYIPVLPSVTLALRALYDRKLAGMPFVNGQQNAVVPFFERMLYEGLAYNEGIGGAGTLPGIARYRISGDEKMLGNAQVRVTVFSTHLASKPQDWGVGVGVGAARAQQPGYAPVQAVSFTGGLRLVWDRALIARLEVGRAPGGDNTLYFAFGEEY